MPDKKRSYTKPEFEFEFSKDAAAWNWDLAKRKIQRVINQYKSDKEFEANNPKPKKEPGLGLGRTAELLKKVDH